ncbi:hypothetical protein GCM10011380_00710 [Sphingomonas metalli]|uniref:Uncharacterized protein n=1 Tax=Sphingomonas metalli TaxID=1779358 RepID=A0A916WNP9_9SPHN|nr:hypothetical protein [Sphingomonas metalli]GGB15158.1 hypothetical protein GCM10011380_00710 [Sphingomonas metalli]
MAEILFPSGVELASEGWTLNEPAQVNRSGWTGTRKVVGLPGASLWSSTATIEGIATEDEEAGIRAFFVALRGMRNTFRLQAGCQQTDVTTATVRTGAGNSDTLPMENLPANATVLTAGKFLTVQLPSGHFRLVCLTLPLVTNGQGMGTAVFGPELGEIPVAGTAVELANPFALMAMTKPFSLQRADGLANFSIECEEAR